ncbi:MAG TPA: LLM class flavin-dependent oxidoreductase [Deltaproteobacteria bacterium]|nr:LLM class flavin-dependent oxidoreductase [Deltaproteobacteria bacterium]
MDLAVLDVLPIGSGMAATDALRSATVLAKHADQLGYRRIWYAEHHGMANIASTSPELLIAHVAPSTTRIRLGAGGVMLPNHAPLRVVEQYRTLEALHPGRIDLGIGRAAGTDPLTARALRSAPGQAFGSLLGEVLAFDEGSFPKDHPFARIGVVPTGRLPPIWMLGSSGSSARIAGKLGLGYAFASHFSPTPPEAAIESYRRSFQPSPTAEEPRVILAVHVLCAETQAEAERLALAPRFVLAGLERGQSGPVPTPDEVAATGFDPARDATGPMAQLLVVGDPTEVHQQLTALAQRAGADELMVMTLAHAPEPRIHSYTLLASAFGLQPAPGPQSSPPA